MKTYTVKEASEILGIKPRAVQHRCKRDNVRRKSNRYVITDEIIAKWNEIEDEANAKANAKINAKLTQPKYVTFELQLLQAKIIELEKEIAGYDAMVISEFINEITPAELDAIEDKDIHVGDVKGNLVFVAKGREWAEYSPEEYAMLEIRLKEWYEQQQKLQHQEQLFNVEKLGLKELLDHYKKQFEYQKQQSEKILNMHQTLIDTIQKQNAIAIQRNIIEAADKDVIDKDLKRKD